MEKSEHEVKYDELLASMPNEELAQELLRLTIEHDVSLEGINNLAAFFGRVAMENRGQTQLPGQLSLSFNGAQESVNSNVLRLCVCLPLAQVFKLPTNFMGQIAQNRCYTLARLIKR